MNRRELLKVLGSSAVVQGISPQGPTQTELTEQIGFSTWTAVAPGVWRSTLGSPEPHTPVRSRAIAPDSEALQQLPHTERPPLATPTGKVASRGTELELELAPGELMYGFGLQLLSFQQRNKKRTVRVNADPKVDSGDSHAPVPFYVTTQGYGLLVDTFRQAIFYCGQAHPKPQRDASSVSGEVNTPQMIRTKETALGSKVLVEVPRSSGVDVYLFARPSMCGAVQRYNLFSGGGVLPPEWGLGFWYRAEMHLDAKAVLALAKSLRDDGMPCDVLGLEPGWQTHAYSCSFAWDRERFPDPAGFLKSAADMGFEVNLWEHAFTHPSAPVFRALEPHSGDIAVWGGLVPDFAGEMGRRIFGDYHGRALVDIGVSGFKLDECDNSDFTEGWSFPDQSQFPSGVDGELMHAQFGLRYQDAILDQYRQRNKSTYGLVRSSHALASPYPFVLYSDLYDHRQFIRALVNASFSGLLWCPEVRDASNEEDLIRRLQSVIFSPLAMVNAWYIRNPPWMQIDRDKNNRDQFSESWRHLRDRCREIISWRMRLVPYLRAAFAVYERSGLPPFRALVMDYPHDPTLQHVDDEYMVGDRLLVAPIFAGETERTVTLPDGQWRDFWTGEAIREKKFTLPATTRNIPVYVKEGSLMPWADVSPHTQDPRARRINVRVYGDGQLPWSAPESAGGLHLQWDTHGSQGRFTQSGGSKRPYTVYDWQRLG
ncbi:MAG TPA: TIM-barrel domain-containing protein [Acidobacteriaceae bacterium]|jgi:alpha-D-xyloside xylohydrolase